MDNRLYISPKMLQTMSVRKYFWAYLLLPFQLFAINSFAQSEIANQQPEGSILDGVFIGVNIPHFIYKRAPGLDIQTEIKLALRISGIFNGGIIVEQFMEPSLHTSNMDGYHYGLGLQYYYAPEMNNKYAAFAEMRYHFRNYSMDITGDFSVIDQFGFYMSQLDYNVDVKDNSFKLGAGIKIRLNNVRIVCSGGLRLNGIDISYSGIPENHEFDKNGTEYWHPGTNEAGNFDHRVYAEVTIGYSF